MESMHRRWRSAQHRRTHLEGRHGFVVHINAHPLKAADLLGRASEPLGCTACALALLLEPEEVVVDRGQGRDLEAGRDVLIRRDGRSRRKRRLRLLLLTIGLERRIGRRRRRKGVVLVLVVLLRRQRVRRLPRSRPGHPSLAILGDVRRRRLLNDPKPLLGLPDADEALVEVLAAFVSAETVGQVGEDVVELFALLGPRRKLPDRRLDQAGKLGRRADACAENKVSSGVSEN